MSQLFTLRMTGAALAQTGSGFNDYKALVCVFLFGGNDSGNTIIPIDGGNQNYADYASGRTGLAIPRGDLNNTIITPGGGTRRFAFHPRFGDMANLFNQGNLAIVGNTGTLVEPTTLSQYQNRSVALPPQLFAHNTQQELWQISTADAIGRIGWGGRIADVLQAFGAQNDSGVSMNISIAGANFFLSGNEVTPYAVSPNGAIGLETAGLGSNSDRQIIATAYADLIALQGNPNYSARNELSKAYADVASRALRNEEIISTIDARQDPNTGDSVLRNLAIPGNNSLAAQLGAVARLIESGPTILGQNRQIFFVSLGGFDNHNGLIGPHDDNLTRVNDAFRYFWDALGLLNRRNDVTTFSASDFSRTYRSNGNGSDHGWGGHHFVMGGNQVNGGQLYGDYGNILIGGPEDTGNGRFIPSTSVDEYAFEFANWMGVPMSEMSSLLPNLSRFLDINNSSTHLGFMNV
ncbi:MAG: DUF1501 domain-containing protein [Planctomycetota bacterium]